MAFRGFVKSVRLRVRLFMRPLRGILRAALRVLNGLVALVIVGVVVYGLGFQMESRIGEVAGWFRLAFWLFSAEFLFDVVGDIFARQKLRVAWWLKLISLLLMAFVGVVLLLPQHVVDGSAFLTFVSGIYVIFAVVLVQSLVKLSAVITQSLQSRLSPTMIFVTSFALLCLVGAGLLMLPRSTVRPIHFVDALFTSVSSVCVAGLTTIDVASSFTTMGKGIIALLMQIGGIGIMTFTSFFGLFFAGAHQNQNKMMIKDLIDPEKGVSQIFRTLWYIISITLVMELAGAYAIFLTLGGSTWHDFGDAVFHAISAFCNAGLSTFSGGLFSPDLSGNYALQTVISVLVIVGGLGFPIIFNLTKWLLHVVHSSLQRLFGRRHHYRHVPHLITSNTVIVLVVSSILLLGGTLAFYFSERDGILSQMETGGRWATAFFMSVTARSAGFNTFDMTALSPASLVLIMFLMWIGASPMSTGGGIKTTTFGIAFLNIWNTLRGRSCIEIRHRRIASSTVNRAFIIIFSSIVLIFAGFFTLLCLEPDLPFEALLFETVSAASIGGLSLNITAQLCHASRLVLIALMFIGRVGLISLLTCLIKEKHFMKYQYPSESIPIN
jgi:trk system potassium uptake protein